MSDKLRELATGFIIEDNLLVTCNYVIPDIITASKVVVQLDYFVQSNGEFNKYAELKLDTSRFFATSEEKDVTIVALKEEPGINSEERALINISMAEPIPGENIHLIGHFGGEPLRISIRENQINSITDLHIHFNTSDFYSSGCPVFNDHGELIGMYESGISIKDSSTEEISCQVIRISVIMKWLAAMKKEAQPLEDKSRGIITDTILISSAENSIPLKVPDTAIDKIRDSVFISFAHKDQAKSKLNERLELHLSIVQSIGKRKVWQDDRIQAGLDWKKEIEAALKKTKVAILLVGPNFLNSEFILSKELPDLLLAAETEGVRVIPLITHRVAYNLSILSKFQSFNSPDKPLHEQSKNGQADKVLVELVEEIANLFEVR
jgi:V8-like Glu-specific endopeptidase